MIWSHINNIENNVSAVQGDLVDHGYMSDWPETLSYPHSHSGTQQEKENFSKIINGTPK